tara:strand:+ start:1724 stop:2641 length:918 start_codon:yes stop_codon:yes gene_type:complete
LNISILYGGVSTEHTISIQTGLAVAEAIKDIYNLDMINLNKEINQYPHKLLASDLVFNALHGGDGENGNIQSYLDIHHIPYTGSGAKASKIAMDKNISKHIAQSIDVPTPRWVLVKKELDDDPILHKHFTSQFAYPYIIKPSSEGSTYGLSIVNNESDLNDAIEVAAKFGKEILIEEYIKGKELTVGILNGKPLPIIEIKPKNNLYDFECKYNAGMSEYIVPAELPDAITRKISDDAIKIYNAIGCRHYARADFLLNKENEHYFLEMNTLPGMTSTSLFPKAAKSAGLEFSELIDTIIKIAIMEK